MDVIGTKVLRVFLLAIPSTTGFYYPPPPPPLCKSGLKLVCNVNIVYRNLMSENSQDYARNPQWNYVYVHEFGFRSSADESWGRGRGAGGDDGIMCVFLWIVHFDASV